MREDGVNGLLGVLVLKLPCLRINEPYLHAGRSESRQQPASYISNVDLKVAGFSLRTERLNVATAMQSQREARDVKEASILSTCDVNFRIET